MPLDLPYDPERLAEICRRYHVTRLELFGSRARADSDVDVLVTFAPDADLAWASSLWGLNSKTFSVTRSIWWSARWPSVIGTPISARASSSTSRPSMPPDQRDLGKLRDIVD